MPIQAVKAQTAENNINSLLATMGVKADEAVGRAITALLHTGSHVSMGAMETSAAIQELELTLHQTVFSALESGTLGASEIKQLTSAANISKDLSRLSKLAASLGQKVTEVGKHNDHEDFSSLQPLAIAVSHLCRQTLSSLARLDPVLARNAAAGGASVDAYRDYVLRGQSVHQSHATNEQTLHLIFASRCLEQIADNTTHLAENLVGFLDGRIDPENRQKYSFRRTA
jgi:phosphate transport system protein